MCSPTPTTRNPTTMSFTKADCYGQAHPHETPELIEEKLQAFDSAVAKIATDDKKNVLAAQNQCPQLLTNEFKLQFLRCEVFDEQLAAKRYTKYWDKRVEIFGPAKAFQPLTLDAALQDDHETFQYGLVRLLVDPETQSPVLDPSGRCIVFLDPSLQDKTKHTNESMIRCIWYVFHAALEIESTQQKGIIFLAWPARANTKKFNKALSKELAASMKGCLPVRMSAFHICEAPTVFRVIFPFLKLFLGDQLRQRIREHTGSSTSKSSKKQEGTTKQFKDLTKVGITKEMLPTEMGGDIVLDHKRWLQERAARGL